MRSLPLVAIPAFAPGCGPAEGDTYEDLLTQERIEVAGVGEWRECYEDDSS